MLSGSATTSGRGKRLGGTGAGDGAADGGAGDVPDDGVVPCCAGAAVASAAIIIATGTAPSAALPHGLPPDIARLLITPPS